MTSIFQTPFKLSCEYCYSTGRRFDNHTKYDRHGNLFCMYAIAAIQQEELKKMQHNMKKVIKHEILDVPKEIQKEVQSPIEEYIQPPIEEYIQPPIEPPKENEEFALISKKDYDTLLTIVDTISLLKLSFSSPTINIGKKRTRDE
jgi:hypothetical protein